MSEERPEVDHILEEWRAAAAADSESRLEAVKARAHARVQAALVAPRPALSFFGRFRAMRVLAPATAFVVIVVVVAGWSAPASSPLHGIRLVREQVMLAAAGNNRATDDLEFAEQRLDQAPADPSGAATDLREAHDLLGDAAAHLRSGADLQRLDRDRSRLAALALQFGICPGVSWCPSAPSPSPSPSPTAAAPSSPSPSQPAPQSPSPTLPASRSPSPTPSAGPSALFNDDFEQDAVGSLPSGWLDPNGSWKVELDGSNHIVHNSASGIQRMAAGSSTWTAYTVTANVRIDSGGSAVGVLARYQDANNYDMCKLWQGKLYVAEQKNGVFVVLATVPYSPSGWQRLSIKVSGSTITCQVGSTTASSAKSTFASGQIGLLGDGPVDADTVTVTL